MDKKGLAAGVISVFIWSTSFSLSKIILQYDDGSYKFGVFPYLALRFLFSIGILYPVLIYSGKVKLIKDVYKRNQKELLIVGVAGIGLAYTSQFISLRHTTSINQSVILQLQTFFILLISGFIYKNRIRPLVYMGSIIASGGLFFIIMDRNFCLTSTTLPGDLLSVGSAVCWAILTGIGGEIVNRNDYLIVTVIIETIGAACICPLIVFSRFNDLSVLNWLDWGILIWLGVGNLGFGYILWFYALSHAQSHHIGLLIFTTPLYSFILGHFLLGEKVTLAKILGACLIITGVYIAEKKYGDKNKLDTSRAKLKKAR